MAPIAAINPMIFNAVIRSLNTLNPITEVNNTTDTFVMANTAIDG